MTEPTLDDCITTLDVGEARKWMPDKVVETILRHLRAANSPERRALDEACMELARAERDYVEKRIDLWGWSDAGNRFTDARHAYTRTLTQGETE